MAYISFKDRVALRQKVTFYVKLDLKDGYRQLPVHPSEWHTQVYSLGPDEYYIDLAMPFGKANSSKLFADGLRCNSARALYDSANGVERTRYVVPTWMMPLEVH